jgi:hypothetical protein
VPLPLPLLLCRAKPTGTCEYEVAWAQNSNAGNPHYYAECSGKGICDRSTGECNCFEGYTGIGCRRSVCPNDCSGHGKCRLVSELTVANVVGHAASSPALAYTAWDADKIQACVCDGGYTGADCSQRMCPRGDDPLTVCTDVANQVQSLTLTYSTVAGDGGGALTTFSGDLALYFRDDHNETWVTNTIPNADLLSATAATATGAIVTALTSLPNFKIPDVTVTLTDTTTTAASSTRVFAITFLDTLANAGVSGKQKLLWTDSPLGCPVAGCHPKYNQLRKDTLAVAGTLADATVTLADFAVSSDSVFVPPSAAAASQRVFAATVTITVDSAAAASPQMAHTYKVDWDLNTIAGAAPAGFEVTDVVPLQVLPDAPADQIAADGYVRVPIGYGMYLNVDDQFYTLSGITGAGTKIVTLTINLIKASVAETTAAAVENEDIECSGRGYCDRTSGSCNCFEGHYGHHCGLQTILV